MKTLVIFLLLTFSTAMTQAQGVIQLNEAKVDYNPLFTEVVQKGNTFSAKVKESYLGEFEKDPMAFMTKHFDIQGLISQLEDRKYDTYHVSFKSRKGELKVNYNKEGDVVNAHQRFKNIPLPQAVAQKVFRDNKGWSMVKNVHVAYGKKGKVDKDFYRVTMENGKQRKNVKIDALQEKQVEGVAGML